MILSDVRDYIRRRGQASLSDIARHFDADPDAVRAMLEVWVRKGKVSRGVAAASCGSSCRECDSAAVELYCWTGEAKVPPALPRDCPSV